MDMKGRLFKQLIKKGYSEVGDRKVWDLSNRSFMYMSDELAKKFLEFRNFPRYKKTIVDIESDLIKKSAEKFLTDKKGESCNLIDMGCGDGSKAKAFINSLSNDCKLRYCPVSVSQHLVDLALKNIKESNIANVQEYEPYVADLESLGEVVNYMRKEPYSKSVVLLFGSILASFEIHDYLFNLSQAMLPGDLLVVGNSIRKGDRFSNLEVYKHEIFDSWLTPLIVGLGFDRGDVEYDARFANGRVEGFYKVLRDKRVEHDGRTIDFKAGDEVVTAILYKYYEEELKEFCKMYFRDVEIVTDDESEYALILCRK